MSPSPTSNVVTAATATASQAGSTVPVGMGTFGSGAMTTAAIAVK